MSSEDTSVLESIRTEIKDTYRFRYVVQSFVSTSLRQRYRRSVLGFGWSLLSPIINYGVMAAVFAYHSGGGIQNYFAYFFSGALIFNLLSTITNHSPGIFITNEHYIKKIYVPKLVFVLNSVLVEIINFFFGFCALVLFSLIFGKLTLSFAWITIPYVLFVTALFGLGISSLLSVMTVYFRDLFHVVPIMMQIAFFLTPILYDPKSMPEKFQWILKLNPFSYFVEVLRYPMYQNIFPSMRHLGFVTVLAFGTALIGLYVLKKFDNKIVFKL